MKLRRLEPRLFLVNAIAYGLVGTVLLAIGIPLWAGNDTSITVR